MFSKAFLLLNFKVACQQLYIDYDVARVENSKGDMGLQLNLSNALMTQGQPILPNSDQSAIEDLHSANQA